MKAIVLGDVGSTLVMFVSFFFRRGNFLLNHASHRKLIKKNNIKLTFRYAMPATTGNEDR